MSIYYDPKTNSIWTQSNIPGFHKDHVEVDEVLAPVVQELNKRGYTTAFSCAGHSIETVHEMMIPDEAEAQNWIALGASVEKLERPLVEENITFEYRTVGYAWLNSLYISFVENNRESISALLPNGFSWDDEKTIRYQFKKEVSAYDNDYEFFEERLAACKSLYRWAKNLPTRPFP